jgi:hypothetical protein
VMMASKMSKYMLHSLIENGKDGTDSADSWANSAFQFCVSGWLKQKTAGRLSLFPVATVATVATSVIATAESKLEAPCLFAAPEPFISCSSVHLAANSFPHQPLFGLKLCMFCLIQINCGSPNSQYLIHICTKDTAAICLRTLCRV